MADIVKLLGHYDAFAWIPTIKGGLSLKMVSIKNTLLGDIDKYAVIFKNFLPKSSDTPAKSEHYVAASSLMTVNDEKYGIDYCRTFRYFLRGTINVGTYLDEHFKHFEEQERQGLTDALQADGVFVGHLAIVPNIRRSSKNEAFYEFKSELTQSESAYLAKIKSLSEMYDDYVDARDVKACSMENLMTLRANMLEKWNDLSKTMDCMLEEDTPAFEFDLLLTRDGILLIRDMTAPKWKVIYAAEDTASDYKQNIPIHRVFKMAANYVKYLFHTNYHHHNDHDANLPASNLNCIEPSKDGFRKVFRHQLNAFTT